MKERRFKLRAQPSAFILIGLLVVIGSGQNLAAKLLPALSAAMHKFVDENEDELPPGLGLETGLLGGQRAG